MVGLRQRLGWERGFEGLGFWGYRKLREEGDAKLGGYEGGGCAARMRLDQLLTHMRLGPAEDVSEVQDLG
jgi:hypothetical protein